ncbi:MAG TPA: VOC family protein [Candidatus Deferrimicrobium sp.]|nr:VOC family protein [Candidatus Deferrimicrobium sp.]
MSDENINPDAPLHIRGLNHLTIPVKERYRAARFYIVALGAEAHHESAPDRVAKGLSRSLQFGIRMAANFEIDLFEQEFGQPDWNQSHPHLALDTSAEDLEKWAEHFNKWQIPFVGPVTRSGTKGAEIYFNDPDGNHLEVHCSDVPEEMRSKYHVGPYDKSLCVHKEEWPPKELSDEAERLFQASVTRMRARRKPH